MEKVWSWPWVLTVLFVDILALPWIVFNILDGYFIHPDFEQTLPSLASTPLRRHSMAAHMLLGAICMIIGPFQFIKLIRDAAPSFHRWNGRTFFTSVILCSIAGQIFIIAKGRLVGGYNMTVSFYVAGVAFGVFAVVSWYFARKKDFKRHRNWAIRSILQAFAPFFYRYWYIAVQIVGYKSVSSYDNGNGLDCRGDTCRAYFRPFDMIHAWTYWIFSLVIGEILLAIIRRIDPLPEESLSIHEVGDLCKEESQATEVEHAEEVEGEKQQEEASKQLNRIGVLFALVTFGVSSAAMLNELNWVN